jgi:hypothetical protein
MGGNHYLPDPAMGNGQVGVIMRMRVKERGAKMSGGMYTVVVGRKDLRLLF